jgi:hypothetical protein
MLRFISAALVALALAACSSQTPAQSALLQAGPAAAGRAPMYVNSGNGQAIVTDSGPASGGAVGLGMGEGLYVARGTGTPPYAGQGTGPLGTNWCDYDAPITNATGYHYFCLSANAQGGGLMSYGAGGAASQLPLNLNVNGVTYPFPFTGAGGGNVVGPPSSVVNDVALFNNTSGTLLKNQTQTAFFNGAPNGSIPLAALAVAPVTGPGSSVTGHLATFADTTGHVLADGGTLGPITTLGIGTGLNSGGGNLNCNTATASVVGCATKKLTPLYLINFGYVADNATDNTSAVNAAIAAAIAAGGHVSIMAPQGIGWVGDTTVITADDVWFGCDGAPTSCTMTATSTAGFLHWGNASVGANGGGIDGLTFRGNANVAQTLITFPQGFEKYFNDIFLETGVAQLMDIGNSTAGAGGVYITNLNGQVANVNTPVIQLHKGAGIFVYNASIFSTNTAGTAAASRDFINTFLSWDTIKVSDSFFQFLHGIITAEALTGSVIGDVYIFNNFIDEVSQAVTALADAGGTIADWEIVQNEMTGKAGACMQFSGPGLLSGIIINGNTIRECQNDGILFTGAVTEGRVQNNSISQVNVSAGGFGGLVVANGTSNFLIQNNTLGIDVSGSAGPGAAAHGAIIGTCSHCIITGNRADGSVAPWTLSTFTNKSVVNDNPDLPAATAAVVVGASPFTYTVSARPATVCVTGGTVSAIAQNGTATGITAGCLAAGANETVTVTYTVLPTMVATLH